MGNIRHKQLGIHRNLGLSPLRTVHETVFGRLLTPDFAHLCSAWGSLGSQRLPWWRFTPLVKGADCLFYNVHLGRRAKPGRFGSFASALKNTHFGRECSQILAGKARKYGRFWVFACVPNPGKQRIWRQCPPSAGKQSTKKLPDCPDFTKNTQSSDPFDVL